MRPEDRLKELKATLQRYKSKLQKVKEQLDDGVNPVAIALGITDFFQIESRDE